MTTRKNALVTVVTNPQSAEPLTLKIGVGGNVYNGNPVPIILLRARGGTGGYVFAISSGSLPAGLSLNTTTGQITGTPTTIGRVTFQASVQDSSSTIAYASCTIDVISRLTNTSGTPIIGEIGIPYSFTFTVSGATGSVTWARSAGTLPAGLTLSSAGVLSGTPTGSGGLSYSTITATDAGSGDTLDIASVINITEAIGTFIPLLASLQVGVAFTIDATGNTFGGVPPFTYDKTGLPAWMDFNPSAQQFFGSPPPLSVTPPLPGGFPPTPITASLGIADTLGGTTTMVVMYTVSPGNLNIAIQPQNTGVDVGVPGPFKFNFVGFPSVTNDGETVEITAPSGGGGAVDSVTGDGTTASVDNTDPANPVVSAQLALTAAGAYTDALAATLKTAAFHDVPPSGNASATQVVLGNDSRLGSVTLPARPVGCTFAGNGGALSGTITSPGFWVPYDFTILDWHLGGDGSVGSGTVAVQSSTNQASWATITAALPPVVASARSASSSTLTGWTKTFTGGIWLRFVGSGFSGWTGASLSLGVSTP